jgi:hypothetical protein
MVPLWSPRQATYDIVQKLHKGRTLRSLPERCSIKPPGTPEWVAHLDRNREGSFQVVIALTTTSFLVWGKSHLVEIARDEDGFHKLTADEIFKLGETKTQIEAQAGDVLIMVGGRLVHSSPEVSAGMSERICTYATWDEI